MLQLSHYELTDITALARDWQLLERKAQTSFFLSWNWIGTWLEIFRPSVIVVKAVRQNGSLCGLGLISQKVEKRHGVLHARTLLLHQTGHWDQDQIWIEYNGFLTDQQDSLLIEQQFIQYLCSEYPHWDELVLGGIEENKALQLNLASRLYMHERWSAPCFGVDMKHLRFENISYLASLTQNTRYQIRRSERMYQQFGELTLRRPASQTEALSFFQRIGQLHMRRWGSALHQSGFANPQFVSFHQSLIRLCWEHKQVDLVALYAGEHHIATFYNFFYLNKVFFYLSGIEQISDNKEKPGLLGHSYCIQQYLDHGYDFYDFMGGSERYKSQLGNWHSRLVQVSMQRPRLKLKLERAGRWVKNCLLRSAISKGYPHD
ncbi:GNAT family N-acetyltransferase [Rheinheimera sp. UJ63]|uniref:GNAT family N-acetyltransferase n=1 Tax=Rheinheimera sp. UJ63 TaxID=2910157 RepID=UPI001F36DE0D|nr:GNAT family N-acetyltransferase [Rheinheimera sp. UJ63]MCF4007812.1 GNAT family N-acetyltransferase [Rheinheimera sp. UJ63]